jgi:hypothetical protein
MGRVKRIQLSRPRNGVDRPRRKGRSIDRDRFQALKSTTTADERMLRKVRLCKLTSQPGDAFG